MSPKPRTRREFLKSAPLLVPLVPTPHRGRFRLFPQTEAEYSSRAIELVGRSLVIDMLSPLTLDFDKGGMWLRDPDTFTAEDLERYQSSGIRVFHVAFGIGGPDVHALALEYFGGWNGFLANHPGALLRIDSTTDFDRLQLPRSQEVGVLLGLQNSSHFRRVDDVDKFHGLGQRVSQLTYNSRNLLGNGSTERSDGGLSDFGVAVVERMNEVGMAVDVSHSGDQTTLDAFEVTKKPALLTHGNCRALANHPRCKTDEAISKMAATGGVMGITGVRMFVKTEEPTTVEHVLDHFDHVRDLVGVEHLGIGSDIDLDGYDDMPAELNRSLRAGYKGTYAFRDKIDIDALAHPKRVFDLTEGLIRRGYGDRDIELVLGGNFERVLAEIWNA